MKPTKLIHHFQRTDSSLDRQTYIRLFADLYDLLNGEQKEVLRFINQLVYNPDKYYPDDEVDDRNTSSFVMNWYKRRMHTSRHETFDDVYPLLLDVLSAQEKTTYVNTMTRNILIDDILNDLD